MPAPVSSPLPLYWWRGIPNFGDALSAIVTGYAAGRQVRPAKPQHCEIFALGSILQIAQRNYRELKSTGYRPWIWGSGMMQAIDRDFLKNVRVAMVRGPITAELLGLKTEHFGDPGLLVKEALGGDTPARHDRIGVVLHHSQIADPRFAKLFADEPALQFINVGDPVEQVCRDIASCRHVLASSLHGLIVADAYGVPNTWLDPEQHGRLKYYDYAASIGRALDLPLPVSKIPAYIARLKDKKLPYEEGIERAKATLLSQFPDDLRGPTE